MILTQKVEIDGIRVMVCGHADDICFQDISEHNHYFLICLLRAEARKLRQIIDIGANIGYTATLAAKIALDARILAIEPSARTCEALRYTIAANGMDSRIVTVRALVSAKAGTLQYYDNSTCSALSRICTDGSGTLMAASTVDELAKVYGFDAVDLVKIDTEGHDYEVVLGMERIDRQCSPVIFAEINALTCPDQEGFARYVLREYGGYLYHNSSMRTVQRVLSERDVAETLRLQKKSTGDLVFCRDRFRFEELARRMCMPVPSWARRTVAITPRNLYRFLTGRLHAR